MTSPGPPSAADPSAPSPSAAALVNLRDTVKWMIAASSAVAAVLVAGLQIRDLSGLVGSSPLRLWGAAAAAFVALLLVLFVIVGAVRVLAVPRLSARDLSARETKAGGIPGQVRLEPLRDELVQSLLEQRTYLLGKHDSIFEFYGGYLAVLQAQALLRSGKVARYESQDFKPGDQHDELILTALVWQAQRGVERLEDAAQLKLAEMRFQRLAGRLKIGGVVFAVAVIAFVVLTTTQPGASVVKPSPVHIFIQNAQAAGLPKGCDATELNGIAIGGSFLAPTLVTEPAPGCPSAVIRDHPGIVVVPIINGFPRKKGEPARKRLSPRPSTRVYTVQPGDSLWDISERLLGLKATPRKIDAAWEIIYRYNHSTVGADPNRIFPGQVLRIPIPLKATLSRGWVLLPWLVLTPGMLGSIATHRRKRACGFKGVSGWI